MISSRAKLTCLLVFLLPAFCYTQHKVNLVGVWEILSAKQNGKELPAAGRQIKTITKGRWVWIYQDSKQAVSLLAKKTHEDSLNAYLSLGAGAGTYKLVGNTYTETPEFFAEPDYIGIPLEFTVKVEGNKMYQTGKFPVFEGGKKVREVLLEEVYKRIE